MAYGTSIQRKAKKTQRRLKKIMPKDTYKKVIKGAKKGKARKRA